MLKVGLTGSIAVGKSFVCDVLRELGCHVLDADETSRDVVARGTDGLVEIVRHFGEGVLLTNGELNRKRLGEIVFANDDKRALLNSIVHPRVIAAQDDWIRSLESENPNGIAVIDAALMIESGGYRRLDKLIVVWCEPALQLERLMSRDNLSTEAANQRIATQMPQDEKKRYGDYLIDTSSGFDDTRQQVENIVSRLRTAIA